MNLIERVKSALDSEQTADELDDLRVELIMHTNTTVARLRAITAKDTSTFGENPGPERQKAIDAGDLDTIKAMDEEERSLVSELGVLISLQKRLRAKLDTTKVDEFIAAAPARYAEVAKLATAEAKANAALEAAREETESAIRDLTVQRQHVARTSHLEFPAADETLLWQLMQVRGYSYHRGPDRVGWFAPATHPGQLKITAAALGLPVPRPEQQPEAA